MLWINIAELVVLAAVGVLLAAILLDDLKNYRIRNTTVLMLAGLFLVWCITTGDLSLFLSHVAVAVLVFVVLGVMYQFGMMGGGDLKLLTIAFLWLGLEHGFLFSVLLCVTSLVYIVMASFKWVPSRKLEKGSTVPFGPSIAVAWITTMLIAQVPSVLT